MGRKKRQKRTPLWRRRFRERSEEEERRATMPFTRLVEVGRVAMVNYGKDYGKLVVIVDIIDQARALCDAPDMTRKPMYFKRLAITEFVIDISKSPNEDPHRRPELLQGFREVCRERLGKEAGRQEGQGREDQGCPEVNSMTGRLRGLDRCNMIIDLGIYLALPRGLLCVHAHASFMPPHKHFPCAARPALP